MAKCIRSMQILHMETHGSSAPYCSSCEFISVASTVFHRRVPPLGHFVYMTLCTPHLPWVSSQSMGSVSQYISLPGLSIMLIQVFGDQCRSRTGDVHQSAVGKRIITAKSYTCILHPLTCIQSLQSLIFRHTKQSCPGK